MYLSFRRSKDALLALGFFVLMVVIVFSTLLYVLYVLSMLSRLMLAASRYFIERGTWDDTLEIFINSDGDPSQFAVSPRFLRFGSLCLIDVAFASLYPPQRGMPSLPHLTSLPNVVSPSSPSGLSSSVSEYFGLAREE
jgi:potassium voltage-gated channel Shal-related subfamily D protein 2